MAAKDVLKRERAMRIASGIAWPLGGAAGTFMSTAREPLALRVASAVVVYGLIALLTGDTFVKRYMGRRVQNALHRR
jgi:hypothetical protein